MAKKMDVNNVEEYSFSQLLPLVEYELRCGNSVFVKGGPGIGKSTMFKIIADKLRMEIQNKYPELSYPFIDLRPSHHVPEEIVGVTMPDETRTRMTKLLPFWFPSEPSFVLIEEVNAGVTKQHQAMLYQLMLEKAVSTHKLPMDPVRSAVCCTGNREEDNAIVVPLSSALNNRVAHYVIRPDKEEFLGYARQMGLPSVFLSYIDAKGIEALYNNSGDSDAFPTPRSNEAAAILCKDMDSLPGSTAHDKLQNLKRMVAAHIGASAAQDFYTHMTVYQNIDMTEIMRQGVMPDFTKAMHKEPSFLFSLVYGAASYVLESKDDLIKTAVGANGIRLLRALEHIDGIPGKVRVLQTVFIKHLCSNLKIFSLLRKSHMKEFQPFVKDFHSIIAQAVGVEKANETMEVKAA